MLGQRRLQNAPKIVTSRFFLELESTLASIWGSIWDPKWSPRQLLLRPVFLDFLGSVPAAFLKHSGHHSVYFLHPKPSPGSQIRKYENLCFPLGKARFSRFSTQFPLRKTKENCIRIRSGIGVYILMVFGLFWSPLCGPKSMKINQNDVPQEVWIPEHSQDPNNPLGRLVASLNAGSHVLDYIYMALSIKVVIKRSS
jgi:hypothetical protein